jgi:hypothetical protein
VLKGKLICIYIYTHTYIGYVYIYNIQYHRNKYIKFEGEYHIPKIVS